MELSTKTTQLSWLGSLQMSPELETAQFTKLGLLKLLSLLKKELNIS